jgi:hypothetical protein
MGPDTQSIIMGVHLVGFLLEPLQNRDGTLSAVL